MEALESTYEKLAHMERKHIRDYYDELAMYRKETNMDYRESLFVALTNNQARIEALQFAEGVVMDEMKKRGLWNGSRADKMKMSMSKWRAEQHKKQEEDI